MSLSVETWQRLGSISPTALSEARYEAHFAARVASSLASSLLEAAPDWSHTALSWFPGREALAGRLVPLKVPLRAVVRFESLSIALLDAYGEAQGLFALQGLTVAEAHEQLSSRLRELLGGVPPRPVKAVDYSGAEHALAEGGRFEGGRAPELRELSKWFANADAYLQAYAAATEGAGPVRCWPHHFDMASLTVLDPDEPDAEKARSIGLGFSPGDETICEPYWYVLPWPHLDPADLPELQGGRWHTEGFVAAVLTGTELAAEATPELQVTLLNRFVDSAVAGAKQRLGFGTPKERAAQRLVWHKALSNDELPVGRVKSVACGLTTVCLTHTESGYAALDNRCPHQGGPLGEGSIENGKLRCPWHGWDFDPCTGKSPPPFEDGGVSTYEVDVRKDGIYVGIEAEPPHEPTVSDVMVQTMSNWGVRQVWGMVGHSNLGLADALRREVSKGRLSYYGIRHEGAAAFAASAYGKLTGRPAACLAIAGPGATNLLTGLWDAHVDRSPVLALTGQVQTQVMGPGAFQEVDLAAAFGSVANWSQPVLTTSRHAELVNLAIKTSILERGVSQLIFPDEVQARPAAEGATPGGPEGRLAALDIPPAQSALQAAKQALVEAKRPVIIVGHGARFSMQSVTALAESLNCPVLTTFKGKGLIADTHPLGCGVLGRSGTPIASWFMNEADLLLVFGASFSNHTGITSYKKTIQVDTDPMALGRFHGITVPVLGDISLTAQALQSTAAGQSTVDQRPEIAARWKIWRDEKLSRRGDDRGRGLDSATLFHTLSEVVPDDAIMCVDVGNNTYSFGRYFECAQQSVLMSGYLGSIGFSLPAAMGAWAATQEQGSRFEGRKVVSVSGDGGFGQYMAELTTAVKYGMNITHVLLNNGQLGKISKEQRAGHWDVWQTALVNPSFADYANNCGAKGFRVDGRGDLQAALQAALAVDGPSLVEVVTDADLI